VSNAGFIVSDLVGGTTNTAQTLDTNGFPVVVGQGFVIGQGNGLVLIHCHDVLCSGYDANLIFPGTLSSTKPSIAINADGYPIMAFDDGSSLGVLNCLNPGCTQHQGRRLDTTSSLSAKGVRPTSIAIGADGFPLVSYVLKDGAARVVHCASVDCLTGSPVITDLSANTLGSAPKVDTSVAIGPDGLGLIALGGNALVVAHCLDLSCTSTSVTLPCFGLNCSPTGIAVPDDSVALTFGVDGLPLIGYRSGGNLPAARLIHCTQAQCVGETGGGATVDSATGDQGEYSWVTVEPNGHALMTYRDTTNSLLRAAYCLDLACSTFNLATIDTSATEFGSVVIGVDGWPLVVAGNSTTHSLKAFHCSNMFCLPYVRYR
jgi:hypothetical protein